MNADTTPCHLPGVRQEIHEAVRRLHGRARHVFGRQPEATVAGTTDWYVQELTCAGDAPGAELNERARAAAREIVTDLVDCPDFAWWGTQLGRAVAWWIGYRPNEEQVPREAVAEILGVSRQRVHRIVMSKLEAAGNQTFSPGEVRTLLKDRWYRQQDAA